MKNPYGLQNGRIVMVSEVARGLACDCVCPACGHPLEARQGDVKDHYFAHAKGADCGLGYQTALHLLAKEILDQEKRVFVPRLRVFVEKTLLKVGTFCLSRDIIKTGTTVRFDNVALEFRTGQIIPDVVMTKRDRHLFVEITVTHGIDDAKLARIRELTISTIEFNFSKLSRVITADELKCELLFNKSRCARWAFHIDAKPAIDELNAEYTKKYLEPAPQGPPTLPKQGSLFQ